MRRLVLFMESNSSLAKGEKYGLLSRNAVLYNELIRRGRFDSVMWFTYGHDDHALLRRHQQDGTISQNLSLLTPPRLLRGRWGGLVYSIVGPLLHRRAIASAEILKTHQVSGSWTALIAKLLTRRPLLFRMGYPLAVRFKSENRTISHHLARAIEAALTRMADAVAVSSDEMRAYYQKYSPGADVRVIPSYADSANTKRTRALSAADPILFVGRLEPVKNVENLTKACARLNVPLHIYGTGSLEAPLRASAQALGADVTFMGIVPNAELVRRHADYSIYVLCSTREGMPKSLIEAMASGLYCVGTPTGGIAELITHRKTGYLAKGFDDAAIAAAVGDVLGDLDADIARSGQEAVHAQNSLAHSVELEIKLINDITARTVRKSG